jgi:hypothetical protein
MTSSLKYNIKEIKDISFSGFNYEIPEESVSIINYLCSQVGSQGLLSNVFQKSEIEKNTDNLNTANSIFKSNNKKRRMNKGMEINAEDWESIRTFQATKIEQKIGIDNDIDQIRLLLNKLTDRTYLDMREKIIEKIDKIGLQEENIERQENITDEDYKKVGNMIYEISSTNKFYSKIFAGLFIELIEKYSWLKELFNDKQDNIMEQYKNIQYVDPDENYDKFCDMNKVNEKRKAVTCFFVNLALNGYIENKNIVKMLKDLLTIVMNLIVEQDKKNEVDELTENIAILFNKDILDSVIKGEDYNEEEYLINNKTIIETITTLAKCKAKDYVSLSNKAIFKYMDLIEM